MSVGLVLVSHSARLAQGARELAEQVAPEGLPIAAVEASLGSTLEAVLATAEAARQQGKLA